MARRESREGKKRAARSSENDSIRSHINLLPADIPNPVGSLRYQRGSLLLSFRHSTVQLGPRPRRLFPPRRFLSLFPPYIFSRGGYSRRVLPRPLGRGINYAPCALAGIPRPVPVFAALLIRAPRPLPFSFLLPLALSPSSLRSEDPGARERPLFAPSRGSPPCRRPLRLSARILYFCSPTLLRLQDCL